MSLISTLTAALNDDTRAWTVGAVVPHAHEETVWTPGTPPDPATPSTVNVLITTYQLRDNTGLVLTFTVTLENGALDGIMLISEGIAFDVTSAAIRTRLEYLGGWAKVAREAALIEALS